MTSLLVLSRTQWTKKKLSQFNDDKKKTKYGNAIYISALFFYVINHCQFQHGKGASHECHGYTGILITTSWSSPLVLSVISIQQNAHSSRHGKSEIWKQIEIDIFIKLSGDTSETVIVIIFEMKKNRKFREILSNKSHLNPFNDFTMIIFILNKQTG